ncbi:MAG: hypothetical protein J07AB43_16740 [Candidatus Nanosalina sp. J07AB43]|nr:MAG: hypothetical protein J07AB43_16740 [Candidatus Nanosalina sp. J07AB43]
MDNRLEKGSRILVLIGALNWMFTGLGLISQGSRTVYNPVFQISSLLGIPIFEAVIYTLVGFSALYQIHFNFELQ